MLNSASIKMREALGAFRARATSRFDAWINEVTGFGTARDKTTYGYVLPNRMLEDVELSALYHADDMAARMVDVVPQEMLREPFSIETGDPKLDEVIQEKFDALDVRGNFQEGSKWGRCYGGGAVLIGADDGQEAWKPLKPARANDVEWLYPLDRRLLWPVDFYEEPGPKFGTPKTYAVTAAGAKSSPTMLVHESRLILFRGASTGIRERQQLFGWDMSVLQRAYNVLRSFNTGWAAVETLLTDGNQAIFKMTGLAEMIGANEQAKLQARLQIIELYRSVMRAIVVDADAKEEFTRHSVSFSEIPATLEKFMLRLAAAVQIPVTILMGQSPAGMNATGESDFRWFYDRIRAEQTTMLAPKIRRLLVIWLQSKASPTRTRPKSLTVKFTPLWTETPLVQAQRQSAIAQRDSTYIQAQVLLPEEVAIARFGIAGGFEDEVRLSDDAIKARQAVLEADLEQMENPPDPTEMGGPGAPPGMGGPPPQGGPPQQGGPQQGGPPQLPPGVAQKPKPTQDDYERARVRTDATSGPRLFELYRIEDETGVSGTGVVAHGAVFEDGTVAMRWLTKHRSTTLFDSLDEVREIHGHGGKTEIRFLDDAVRTDDWDEANVERVPAGEPDGGRFTPKDGDSSSEPRSGDKSARISSIVESEGVSGDVAERIDRLESRGLSREQAKALADFDEEHLFKNGEPPPIAERASERAALARVIRSQAATEEDTRNTFNERAHLDAAEAVASKLRDEHYDALSQYTKGYDTSIRKLESGADPEEVTRATQAHLDQRIAESGYTLNEAGTLYRSQPDRYGDQHVRTPEELAKQFLHGASSAADHTERAQQAIEHLNGIFRDVPPTPGTVYRGLKQVPPRVVEKMLNSQTFTLDSMTSFSDHRDVATQFASLEKEDLDRGATAAVLPHGFDAVIRVQHKSGVTVSGASEYQNEAEVLLPKGTRFRIRSVKRESYAQVDLEIGRPPRLLIDAEEVQ